MDDNIETKTGNDTNNCGTTDDRDALSQSCGTPPTNTTCIQNWSCLNWSECTNGNQVRECSDSKSCTNQSEKPSTNQTCTIACDAEWDCGDWEPEECPKNETQTKTCTDLSTCGDATKIETQNCTYENKFGTTWIIIISIAGILVLIGIIFFAIFVNKSKANKIGGPGGAPGFPPNTGPRMPPSQQGIPIPRKPMQRLPQTIPQLPAQRPTY